MKTEIEEHIVLVTVVAVATTLVAVLVIIFSLALTKNFDDKPPTTTTISGTITDIQPHDNNITITMEDNRVYTNLSVTNPQHYLQTGHHHTITVDKYGQIQTIEIAPQPPC